MEAGATRQTDTESAPQGREASIEQKVKAREEI
jgi:hypothetical protein